MSRKHLPAAVPVSIGCSVALSDAPPALDCANDVLQIADAPRQTINPGDHQNIALSEKVEDGAQFLAPGRCRPAALLGADHLAPGRPAVDLSA
jgi:hypothetical protein